MSLTGGQLTQLMNHPHRSKALAVIHTPSIVFQCEVETGFYDHNVVAVPYENEFGLYSDVLDGMTMYVYDSLGRLRGKIRTKSADDTYIYLAENDEVTFDDGQTLVITDEMPFWTKFPYCDVSGSEPVFYKDYNIAYTDQNDYPPPVPILGPALRVAILSEDDTLTWSASSSYSPRTGGTISTYSWQFQGGTPGSSSDPSEDVTYATPGIYRTTLTITDDQGRTAKAYRWVRVLATRLDASVIQCTASLQGSFSQGGWTAKIEGHTNRDLSDVPDHSLVAVICTSVDGDNVLLDFGGFAGATDVYFCGYLLKDTVQQEPDNERVSFEAATIERVMASSFGFDAFVHDVSSPSSWIELNGVNTRSAANHLVRWHSNLMEIADVHLPWELTATAGIDMPQADFYSQLKNMCQSVRLVQVGCTRYGAVRMQKDVQHLTWSDRYSYGKHFDMFKALWTSRPLSIPRQHRRKVSMLECAGVKWNGSEPEPLFSRAPGIVPVNEGRVEEVSGLAVASQDDINTVCGMIYAEKINPLVGLQFEMSGNLMPAADVFPQHMMKLPSDFEIRGQSYENEWMVVRDISFKVSDGGTPEVTWTIDVLCQESTARLFTYPLEPYTPPPPPTPPPPVPPPPAPPPEGFPATVIVLHKRNIMEADISQATPVWSRLHNNLPEPLAEDAVWFSRDPEYPNTVGYLATRSYIYRNDGLNSGGDWNIKLNKSAIIAAMNDSIGGGGGNVDDCDIRKMKPQVSLPGALYVVAAGHFTTGQGWNAHWVFFSFDRGQTWGHGHYLGDRCDDYYGYEWWTGGFHSWSSGSGQGQLSPSAHNPLTVHAWGNVRYATASGRQCYWRLHQGNFSHSLSWERWGGSTYGTNEHWAGHIPYKDNPEDKLAYLLRFYNGSYQHIAKWSNGGWSDYSNWRNCTGRASRWEEPVSLNFVDYTVQPVPALFGTFTYDKDYAWLANAGGPDVRLSDDGGTTWQELADIPVGSDWASGCCSGYPYDKALFMVGRNPNYKGATGLSPQMLYYSTDAGESWIDASGNLYTLTGGGGLICIAPRWN